jgi:hypothetical protein
VFEFYALLIKKIACVTIDQRATTSQAAVFNPGHKRGGVWSRSEEAITVVKKKNQSFVISTAQLTARVAPCSPRRQGRPGILSQWNASGLLSLVCFCLLNEDFEVFLSIPKSFELN